MDKLEFFDAIAYKERTFLGTVDEFFFLGHKEVDFAGHKWTLGNRRAKVITPATPSQEGTVQIDEKDAPSWLSVAVKVFLYCTVAAPLIMLVLKLGLRSRFKFHVVEPSSSTEPESSSNLNTVQTVTTTAAQALSMSQAPVKEAYISAESHTRPSTDSPPAKPMSQLSVPTPPQAILPPAIQPLFFPTPLSTSLPAAKSLEEGEEKVSTEKYGIEDVTDLVIRIQTQELSPDKVIERMKQDDSALAMLMLELSKHSTLATYATAFSVIGGEKVDSNKIKDPISFLTVWNLILKQCPNNWSNILYNILVIDENNSIVKLIIENLSIRQQLSFSNFITKQIYKHSSAHDLFSKLITMSYDSDTGKFSDIMLNTISTSLLALRNKPEVYAKCFVATANALGDAILGKIAKNVFLKKPTLEQGRSTFHALRDAFAVICKLDPSFHINQNERDPRTAAILEEIAKTEKPSILLSYYIFFYKLWDHPLSTITLEKFVHDRLPSGFPRFLGAVISRDTETFKKVIQLLETLLPKKRMRSSVLTSTKNYLPPERDGLIAILDTAASS